jgi:predicted phosphodiesterase
MNLIIGDLHLTNEINDRYSIQMEHLKYVLDELKDKFFNGNLSIDRITLLGDVMDCEYITYRKVVYFNDFIQFLKSTFSETKDIKIIIGNHDKYSTIDGEKNNILRYFHDDIISVPTVENGILYLPHYYNKENLDLSILDEGVKVVLAHAGTRDVFGNDEVTVEYLSKHFSSDVPIISGHLHKYTFNQKKNYYIIGAMKAESFNDERLGCYVSLIDEETGKVFFLEIPYYKVYQIIRGETETEIKENLERVFSDIINLNTQIRLLDENENVVFESNLGVDSLFTRIVNLRFEIDNGEVKPKNVSALLELVIHEIENDLFHASKPKINSVFKLTKTKDEKSDEEALEVDEIVARTNVILPKVTEFVNDIRNSNDKTKQIKKHIDSITEDELSAFARYLAFMEFGEEFETIKSLIFGEKIEG